MKPHLQTLSFITLILFFLVISPGTATTKRQVSIDSISAYMGQNVTVCSRVYGTHVTKGEKPVTFLNLGADYPNQKLTIVIFYKDAVNFTFVPYDHYKNEDVCVTGKLTLYKGREQIIVKSPEQMELTTK